MGAQLLPPGGRGSGDPLVGNPLAGDELAAAAPAYAPAERAQELALLNRLSDGIGVFLGGPANVVLQLSWPEVGYGVLESRVESGQVTKHPFKRFRTTIGYLGIAMWGSDERRAEFRSAVDGAHRQVRSTPESPVKYNAFNRELQLWVATCLHYGLRDIFTRLHGPLSAEDDAVLLRAGARFGTTLQVPQDHWHEDMDAFWAYWEAGLSRVRIDPPVRDYFLHLLRMRILPFPLDKLLGRPMLWVNTGFLPELFREELGLPWTARDEAAHRRLVRTLGAASSVLPGPVRRFPINAMTLDIDVRRRLGRPLV